MKLPVIQLKKLVFYLIFWAVTFYAALEVFSRTDEIRIIDVIYTSLFIIPFVLIVSLHSFHLIPKYLEKSRFWLYGLTLFVLVTAAYPIYNFSYLVLSEWFFPDYYLVGVYSPPEIVGFTIFFLLISSSLEFARNWFEGLRAKNRVSELETENVASELKALRAQVNPHFLFNSLNTIYNEALKKSDKAPLLIIKLSDMLRYVVNKINQERVSLEEEIEYLKNYISLHKERLNEPTKVSFLLSGDFNSLKIAPLLMLNFVENAFKHADLTDEDAFISIDISTHGKELTFKCSNSYFEDSSKQTYSSGSGIDNAIRRLELSYPNRHSLNIKKTAKIYHLELILELD